MAPILTFLLALGSLASTGAAWYPEKHPEPQTPYSNNTLITFQKQGCHDTKCGFVYHNFQPRTCAVTITRRGLNISEAIGAKLTLVKSGLLIRNESGYADPNFVAWNEGPDSNQDGPLQCGTVLVQETVTGNELCISAPDNQNYHGFSYWRPGDNDTKRADVPECEGEQYPDGVMLNGKMYNVEGIPDEDRSALFNAALNGGGEVPAKLDQYLVD